MAYQNEDPANKIDFAVFPNKNANSSKHPELVGTVEFGREILKTMVEEAKAGRFPVVMSVAIWPERVAKSGNLWRGAKLEVKKPKPEVKPEPEPSDDDLLF
jgi:hypothetical protein